jgi:hypothetical protein
MATENNAPVVVAFLVPTVDNETRKSHPKALWTALEASLVDRFGGLTRTGTVRGQWKDGEGRLIREPSRAYEVDVPADKLPAVRALLSGACAAFGQQCLRATFEGRAYYLDPDATQVAPHGLAL